MGGQVGVAPRPRQGAWLDRAGQAEGL